MQAFRQWPLRAPAGAGWRGALPKALARPLRTVAGSPPPGAGVLHLYPDGRWSLGHGETAGLLDLAHVWHAYAWLGLRFTDPAKPEAGPVHITCWKFAMSAQDWRELCVCVARQLAMPGRAFSKESP